MKIELIQFLNTLCISMHVCKNNQPFFNFVLLSLTRLLPTKFNQSIKGKGPLEWPSYWTWAEKYDLHKMAMKVSLMQKEMQLRTLDCSRITQVLDRRAHLIIWFMERVLEWLVIEPTEESMTCIKWPWKSVSCKKRCNSGL